MDEKRYDLSLIIPVFNEEHSLSLLYHKITENLISLAKTYEIIFIDDGSTDNSFSILKHIYASDNRVKVIKFHRNMGKAAVYSAGFHVSKGDIIITMDADLQDDPADIKNLLDKIDEGYDLVTGWKYTSKGSLMKTLSSRIFNGLVCLITGTKLHDINCPFKAYRKNVIKELKIYGDLYRFITVIMADKGYKIAEVKIRNHPRAFGKSKYGPSRFIKGLLDLLTIIFITKYSRRPLHLFGSIGIFSFVFGFCIDAYFTTRGLIIGRIGHSAMLLFGVLLMIMGIQLISMGIICEFIISQKKTKEHDFNIELFLER